MRTGHTLKSAVLRSGPTDHSDPVDKLEPNYPLWLVYRREDGWVKVIAQAKGPRNEAQAGYIWHTLIAWDEPNDPPVLDIDLAPWIVGSALIILVLILAFYLTY